MNVFIARFEKCMCLKHKSKKRFVQDMKKKSKMLKVRIQNVFQERLRKLPCSMQVKKWIFSEQGQQNHCVLGK